MNSEPNLNDNGFGTDLLRPEEQESGIEQSDGMDMLAGDDGLAGGHSKPKIPGYLLLMLVLVAAAGVVLFGMRKVGLGPGTLLAETTTIDYDPLQQSKAVTPEERKLLSDLGADRSNGQIPPEDIQKNPFELAEALKRQEEDKPQEIRRGPDPLELAAQRKVKVKAFVDRLKINSILGGSRPLARINNEPYRVGDGIPLSVDGTDAELTVAEVHGHTVVLVFENNRYILSMIDPDDPRVSGRR